MGDLPPGGFRGIRITLFHIEYIISSNIRLLLHTFNHYDYKHTIIYGDLGPRSLLPSAWKGKKVMTARLTEDALKMLLYVGRNGACSRADIARNLGFSQSRVARLLEPLIKRGLLRESGQVPLRRGASLDPARPRSHEPPALRDPRLPSLRGAGGAARSRGPHPRGGAPRSLARARTRGPGGRPGPGRGVLPGPAASGRSAPPGRGARLVGARGPGGGEGAHLAGLSEVPERGPGPPRERAPRGARLRGERGGPVDPGRDVVRPRPGVEPLPVPLCRAGGTQWAS